MDELIVVLVTFPNEEAVRQIGTELVKKQLIACVNVIPKLTSIYEWEGKVCEESECLAIMKTMASKYLALEKLVQELHPYEVPEIIALEAKQVSESYLGWVSQIK